MEMVISKHFLFFWERFGIIIQLIDNHLYKMVGHQVPGIDNIVHGNCCDTLDFFRSLAQRNDLTERHGL